MSYSKLYLPLTLKLEELFPKTNVPKTLQGLQSWIGRVWRVLSIYPKRDTGWSSEKYKPL